MSSHPYPYIRQYHPCLNCGAQLTGRQGYFCPDNDECQAARVKRKKPTEKAWVAIHKPWKKRNYENRARPPEPEGQCQFCHHPIPSSWRYPICEKCRSRRFGMDSMYGEVM